MNLGRSILLVSVALVTTVGIAGCGNGTSPSAGSAAPQTATATPAHASQTPPGDQASPSADDSGFSASFVSACGAKAPEPAKLSSVDLATVKQIRICVFDEDGREHTWIDKSGTVLPALRKTRTKIESDQGCPADLAAPVSFVVRDGTGTSTLAINVAGCWSVIEPQAERYFTIADEQALRAQFKSHHPVG